MESAGPSRIPGTKSHSNSIGAARNLGSASASIAPRFWVVIGLLGVAASGCVSKPPALPSAPEPVSRPRAAALQESTCSSCAEQTREIGRLRQELANRDDQLRDLRSNQRDQVKVLQESKREVTRAKVKLRRLATRADAASYIAEVEVAMHSLRSSLGAKSAAPMMNLAQGLLESTDAPFAQGDYGLAIDRAAQAEQLIAAAADNQAQRRSPPRRKGQVPLQAGIPLKVTVDVTPRPRPLRKVRGVNLPKKGSLLVARLQGQLDASGNR